MEPPHISIVTPSYNQGEFIEETITSVLSQGYPRLQYTIIDGGSTDNTVEVIKKYADRLDYWVSEKDRGQSHAINKGLERSTGDIFNWINSDDALMPGALWTVARAWMTKPGAIISGATELFNESGVFEVARANGQTLRNFVRFWEAKDFSWTQQGTFLPCADLRAIRGVREDLKYCMDYYMMVQLLMRNLEVVYVDAPLSRFRYHAASKTTGNSKNCRLERIPALRSMANQPVPVEDWEWDEEQARRIVDIARHAWRTDGAFEALRYIGRALKTSPVGTMQEIGRRAGLKLAPGES
ncbi:MAG TPA: glycosyltransferase family 2 protein [Verrucomicrobiae bacterium]|nr:glycosyltransferase family 2 protein [Verrucomicrobiae bacterium]